MNGKILPPESLLLVFKLNGDNFGIRGEKIREVLNISSITPVPRAPSFITGITDVRGKILTVLDVAQLLGLPSFSVDRNSKILFLEHEDMDIGFMVKLLKEVRRMPSDFLPTSPGPPSKNGVGGKFVEGVAELDKIPVKLLDVDGLLRFVDEYIAESAK